MALIVTIKPVIMRAQQRADGSYNVKIRVTFKRRYRILSTNLTAYPRDLARSGEIKGAVLLDANRLVEKMYSAVAELNWFDLEYMEVDDIVRHIRGSLRSRTAFALDFFDYSEKFVGTKKEGTAHTYRTAVNSFRSFLGRGEFDINEFSVPLIKRYVDYLNTTPKGNGHGETTRMKKKGVSARFYTQKLSAIYNEAANEYNDEDAGVVRVKANPFRKVKVDALPSVAKISKSPDFIQKVIDAVSDPKTKDNHRTALEIYLLSFGMMGVNGADLMTMTKADADGIVTYWRTKTKDRSFDQAEMHMRLEPCILPLVRKYAGRGELLLDLAVRWPSASRLNGYVRKALCSWAAANGEDPFTLNSARHTWATIGRSGRVGLEKSLVDECLAHSAHKLVDVYAEKDWSIYWEANRKVLGIFDWTAIK